MEQFLEPTYLEIDFQTSKERLKRLMEESDTFKDYNYEGANITMLLELIAFLNDNNTYFINKLVKNIYPESAEVYETVHSIASIRGYSPKGYIAPNINLKVKILVDEDENNLPSPGEQLYIPAWFRIDTGMETTDGESIEYMTTKDYVIEIPADMEYGEYIFDLLMKQGRPEIIRFTGEDIVDNKIFLPFFKFDHDLPPYDQNPSITLYVNGDPWIRVGNFEHHQIDEEREIYMLEFDKYQRYNIVFSPSHKKPSSNDNIVIFANRTNGTEGNIYSGFITDFEMERETPKLEDGDIIREEERFISNLSREMTISKDYIEVTNPDSSFNASSPETIEQIRRNSRSVMYSQNRNVTPRDYREHLAEHPDVVGENAWGEKEINPQNTEEYNKVYISIIPREFKNETIVYENVTWEREEGLKEDIIKPINYNNSFKMDIYKHLEKRKGISVYETLLLPELIYFAFDIGITIRRSYNFVNVREDLKRKLQFYFREAEREFNDIIDFKRLQNFILDHSVRDEQNRRFRLVRGIDSVVFRDIVIYNTSNTENPEMIYEPNEDMNYPMFTEETFEQDYDNILRPIKLGLKQFPVLSIDNCVFIQEK